MRDVKRLQPQRRGQVGQQAVIQHCAVGQIEVLHGGAQLADAQDAAGAHVQRTAHLVAGHMRDEEKAGQRRHDEGYTDAGQVCACACACACCCCRDSYCRLQTAHPRMKGYPKP